MKRNKFGDVHKKVNVHTVMNASVRGRRLVDALNALVPFEQQDPDEQFYPARCSHSRHYWHENADAEGDTCNCGAWYRFADRIEVAR